MEIMMKVIGVIHTPLIEKNNAPIQSSRSDIAGTVEVFPQYHDGLDGIEGFSHLYLLYGFHRCESEISLKVQPFLDNQLHGIFATSYPCRPNPLGLSVVQLIKKQDNFYNLKARYARWNAIIGYQALYSGVRYFHFYKTGWYQKRNYT